MDNTSKNVGDVISLLRLQCNRDRQAPITNELADITQQDFSTEEPNSPTRVHFASMSLHKGGIDGVCEIEFGDVASNAVLHFVRRETS
jgi:hypothetical protein